MILTVAYRTKTNLHVHTLSKMNFIEQISIDLYFVITCNFFFIFKAFFPTVQSFEIKCIMRKKSQKQVQKKEEKKNNQWYDIYDESVKSKGTRH